MISSFWRPIVVHPRRALRLRSRLGPPRSHRLSITIKMCMFRQALQHDRPTMKSIRNALALSVTAGLAASSLAHAQSTGHDQGHAIFLTTNDARSNEVMA
jgi:hypothetical protein